MVEDINNLLQAICDKLSEGDALNYVADAEIYQAEITGENNEIELIKKTFGKDAAVGAIYKSDLVQLLRTVKECFEYEGDGGSHPNRNYLKTEQLRVNINAILENLKDLFQESDEIYEFGLGKGHPFYPVIWDYAFLVKNDKEYFILIGSCSD